MQTFLPYPDFRASAACLDMRRLGKQRVEAYQILRTLRGERRGWANHPAVLMWKGREAALGAYMNACIDEWVSRGYKNTMQKVRVSRWKPPAWLGDEAFHAAHRSNLLRKDSVHYTRFGWSEGPALPYVWPVAAVVPSRRPRSKWPLALVPSG